MKRKKLYYVPGLISALVLPVLLVYFDLGRPAEKVTLQLFLASDRKDTGEEMRFTKHRLYKDIAKKRKNIVSIKSLNEFIEPDNRDMFVYTSNREFLADEMRKLKFNHDTTQVLEVRLSYENTYGDFVWVINLANLFQLKRYAWVDNSIFFFTEPPPVYQEPWTIEVDLSDTILPSPEPTDWELFWWDIKYRLEVFWYYISLHYITMIAFVLLIIIPGIIGIRRMKKRLSRRTLVVSEGTAA
ncbi:MAG: hypothetical protein WCF67_05900 [Chitinophagaceae bacterium]